MIAMGWGEREMDGDGVTGLFGVMGTRTDGVGVVGVILCIELLSDECGSAVKLVRKGLYSQEGASFASRDVAEGGETSSVVATVEIAVETERLDLIED